MNAEPSLRQQAEILLIPGMLNPPSIWDAVIAILRERFGTSVGIKVADVSTQSSITDMAQDAWQCFDDVPVETPCYIVGFSMGGYVAQEMLVTPKRAIHGAWLIATSAKTENPDSAPLREKAIANFSQDFEKSIQSTARWGTHEKTPEELEPLVQAMREVGAKTAIRQTQAIMQRRNLRDRLRELEIPVHVICGEQDRITPAALAQDIASIVPKAQLQLIPDAGHMLPYEAPHAIAQSLAARISA